MMNLKWLKKYSSLLTAGIMAASLVMTGCGSASDSASSKEETASEAAVSESAASAVSEAEETAEEKAEEETTEEPEEESAKEEKSSGGDISNAPEIPGLTCESAADLTYAEVFDIYYYNDDYKVIDVHDDRTYLIIPEDGTEPEGIDEDIILLQAPLDTIYLAASSAMALFDAMDGLDSIRLSGTQESGWYIDNAVQAMKNGDILFGGKYNKPDYEMLIAEGCNLAIESTMILHSPKVQEMIEDLGIPVFIDRSSYESHPLARTEWVKVYGALIGHEEEAEAFFEKEIKVIEKLNDFENTGKTVAYFYINTDGSAIVRSTNDYIPKMIEMAGGKYIFSDLEKADGSSSASVNISMEQFYATAKDADYLIYNASIDGVLKSMDELLAKDALFSDFKAVKEGHVWTTGKSLYQATDTVGEFILDINEMLTTGDQNNMRFLQEVK